MSVIPTRLQRKPYYLTLEEVDVILDCVSYISTHADMHEKGTNISLIVKVISKITHKRLLSIKEALHYDEGT